MVEKDWPNDDELESLLNFPLRREKKLGMIIAG
jgi:hypothetical protein